MSTCLFQFRVSSAALACFACCDWSTDGKQLDRDSIQETRQSLTRMNLGQYPPLDALIITPSPMNPSPYDARYHAWSEVRGCENSFVKSDRVVEHDVMPRRLQHHDRMLRVALLVRITPAPTTGGIGVGTLTERVHHTRAVS